MRNIVICSDGTGNTFDSRVTNVTHLIRCLALDNHKQQIVVYDQGVGTSTHRWKAVDAYRKGLKDQDALRIPPPPLESTTYQRRSCADKSQRRPNERLTKCPGWESNPHAREGSGV